MPILVRHKDETNIHNKDIYYPEAGVILGAFCKQKFTHNFGGLHTEIYINGNKLLSTADESDAAKLNEALNYQIKHDDKIVIINAPQGIELVVLAVIAILAIAAVIILAPETPGNSESTGSSPNSNLNAATNEFRPDEAIPEVFGSPISYPDFVQPSFYVYENNLKIQREMFCIGVSQYGGITDQGVRTGETILTSIPNSLYEIYEVSKWDGMFPAPPNTYPPEDYRQTVRETNEITNQGMESPDSDAVEDTNNAADDAIISFSGNSTVLVGEDTINNLSLSIGDYVNVKVTETPQGGSPSEVLNGTWQIISVGTDTINIPTGSSYSSTPDSTSVITTQLALPDGSINNWVGYYTVSGNKNTQVWFHVVMPRGIRSENGGKIQVDFLMEIEEIDDDGIPVAGGYTETKAEFIQGSSLDPQYRTYRFESLPEGRYQGRIKRTSNEFGGSAAEEITLEQLVGVEYQGAPNYGDVTLVWVERKASERIVGGSQSKINIDLTRKLPYYNRSTGILEVDNLVPTNDFADAVAYTLCVSANRPQNTVDLAGLYEINDALPENLRRFDFTFDDHNVGLRERISVMCNAARVLAFQDYQSWSFNRIEEKPIHSMLFNRRNTVGQSTQSFPQWLPSDKDSISLTYVEPIDNVKKTIYRRIENGQILDDQAGLYPEELELTGCQNDDQAENRIDYEIRRLIYQRNTVSFDAYYFGLSARIGDRVRWVDMNDQDVFGGEILDVFGDEYLTSESINFEAGKTYYVQVTTEDGDISSLVTCEALSYTTKGFKSSTLQGAYTSSDGNFELGSKYSIACDDELSSTDFTLTSVESNGEGIATITLSEYNNKLFEAD